MLALIFISRKDKNVMIKSKLCPCHKQLPTISIGRSALSASIMTICLTLLHNNAQPWTPVDVNAERMPTNNKPPEPDLQQVTKSMIRSDLQHPKGSLCARDFSVKCCDVLLPTFCQFVNTPVPSLEQRFVPVCTQVA